MKKNGFSYPLNPLQVLSWVVYAADILVVFCVVYVGMEKNRENLTILIATVLSFTCLGVVAVFATRSSSAAVLLKEEEAYAFI